ncbi:hypothetical protein NGM99_05845 [Mesorhizobium sp. RP14(2022)]|uniref:Uncharacterized protein n=1 Tax=Mesorhizobium liriopis TaxID=2953882 RepID=A0ABT1C5R7_9HYPH|nr:hypothetical protein [Mesorhizobium liriopis]MCO6049311.1 hypothetical protein [Mesorhizobium liriopis]
MTESGPDLIAELMQGADNIDTLSGRERSTLLRRAASTIRKYHEAKLGENERKQLPSVGMLMAAAETPFAGSNAEVARSLRLAAGLIAGYREMAMLAQH